MSIHWSLKWSIFAASVLSLSWFFAGWRAINERGGIWDWGLLAGGTAATVFLLTIQGYWIYHEEKQKGRLTKKIELFEKIESYLKERKAAAGAKAKQSISVSEAVKKQSLSESDINGRRE